MSKMADRTQRAYDLLVNDQTLPGVTRTVAVNLFATSGGSTALDYLLGVTDLATAIGHPNARAMKATRDAIKNALRGEED